MRHFRTRRQEKRTLYVALILIALMGILTGGFYAVQQDNPVHVAPLEIE